MDKYLFTRDELQSLLVRAFKSGFQNKGYNTLGVAERLINDSEDKKVQSDDKKAQEQAAEVTSIVPQTKDAYEELLD